jgi:hypothetical protein
MEAWKHWSYHAVDNGTMAEGLDDALANSGHGSLI